MAWCIGMRNNPKIVKNDNFARRVTNPEGTLRIVRINPDIENGFNDTRK